MIKLPGLRNPIQVATICYLASHSNYCWLYLVNGRRLLVSKHLGSYTPLRTNFNRIHKKYLVNPDHVRGFDRTGPERANVLLSDSTVLPVANRRLTDVHRIVKQLANGEVIYP